MSFWHKAGIIENDIIALLPQSTSISSQSTKEKEIYLSKNNLNNFDNIFCSNDGRLDLKEVTNWRVFHILSILRNLSFEECNKVPMAENITLLKFVFFSIF